VHNKRYKALGFRWLFERSAPHQVRCNLTGKSPAIPNDFIPPTVAARNHQHETKMNIINILVPLGFVLFFVLIIVIVSLVQLRQKKYTLEKLSKFNLDKVKIRFNQSSVGKGSIVSGMPIKAEMYISDDFFLITPKENGYFNGMNNLNLPVIFVKNESQKQEINLNNVVVPDKVKVSTWNSISINYQKSLIGNIKYSIQVNLLDKNDIEKINKLKNWL